MSYAFLTHILGYYICVYVRLFFLQKASVFFTKSKIKKNFLHTEKFYT